MHLLSPPGLASSIPGIPGTGKGHAPFPGVAARHTLGKAGVFGVGSFLLLRVVGDKVLVLIAGGLRAALF